MKCCVMEEKTKLTNGKIKCRCKHDGSIRNQCNTDHCPHFRPTLFWKFMAKFFY